MEPLDWMLTMFALFSALLFVALLAVLRIHMRERRAFFEYHREVARREADEALEAWWRMVDEEIRING